MNRIFKPFSLLALVMSFVFCFAGCGETTSAVFDESSFRFKVQGEELESEVIAENGEFSLYWDAERAAVMLLENGRPIIGSIPADEYMNPQLSDRILKNLASSVIIEYIDNDTKNLEKLDSYSECLENGRILGEKTEKGFRISYCFDKVNIIIPVDYELHNGYIEASVATKSIKENKTKLYSVSLMTGLVSCKNSAENYIFLPDGSGALYSCSDTLSEQSYWIPMYGGDPSSPDLIKYRNTAAARLPVFGVKNDDKAICAIITGGNECSRINAVTSAGSGYSNAYATFVLRGSTEVSISGVWGRAVVVPTYSDEMTVNQTLSVRYYPLSGEKSAYMQMADCYRNYLISKYGLEKTDSDKQLYLNLTMAATLKKFYFGIPAEKVTALTTCKQTQNILEDVGDIKTAVRLDGIQKGGIEIGKFAGNFKLEQLAAKQNELDTLLKYAKEKNVAVYPNFDIVRFRKGVSGYKMAVYSASTSKSLQYFYNIAKGAEDPSSYIYYLINPLLHITAAQRVVATVQENGFEGVSFGTLSNICYGDYRQRSTYVARGFANRVNSILKDAGKNLSVMGEAANDYAAVMCDDIISSPTSTSRYNGESRVIPLYQLVFKGYVPLSGEAVNLSNRPARELLYNASLGIGSLYSVTNDDTTAFNLSFFSQLSGGSYWQQNNEIKSAVADNTDAFKAAQNESIEDYVFLADDITKTTFSNGKAIIANFTSEDYIYGDTVVKSGGYIVTKRG